MNKFIQLLTRWVFSSTGGEGSSGLTAHQRQAGLHTADRGVKENHGRGG